MNRSLLSLGMCLFSGIAVAQPRITGIFNNASYARPGLQGSGIAQGSIFAVFGERMGPATLVQAGFPLPTTLEGTSIRVTSGNTGVNAFLIYTSAGQLAAVLPSNTPVGNATAQVTYNGQTSEVFPFNVVARSFGIFSINGAGSGAGVVTDANFGVITPNTALQAGGIGILWGTGLGGVLFPDNQAAQVFDLKDQSLVEVFVGNRRANLRYAGRSSCCAGLDQIVFDVPQGIAGCNVSVVVRVAGQISNFTTTAIGADGRTVCSDPGLSNTDLERALASGSQRLGAIVLARSSAKISVPGVGSADSNTDSGSASFTRYDYRSLISRGQVNPSPGDCYVFTFGGQSFTDPVPFVALDAGTALTVTGPRGTKTLNRIPQVNGSYFGELGGGLNIPVPGVPPPQPLFLDPGDYTITGPGGADVGPFTAQVRLSGVFSWTNQDAIADVARNTDLQITWSGGASEDIVLINGSSTRSNPTAGASFFCMERASAGRFSVPALVLSALPPTSTAPGGISSGSLTVSLVPGTNLPRFSASGLDVGFILYNTSHFKQVGYQ